MKKLTRRNILKAAAATGAAGGLGVVINNNRAMPALAQGQGHAHTPASGPLSNATVSFGQWITDPPLDRFPGNVPPAPAVNQHLLTPYETTIKAGGAVNFIIAGLHQVAIYGDGKKPADVNTSLTIPMTGPPNLPLINDADRRIYRGVDPSLFPLDRVEVVTISKPGTYLVICAFLFHFLDNMYGYVKVVP